MKCIAQAVIGLAVLFASCRESGPALDFGLGPKPKDTSYIATVEAPQLRIVLLEEFTGVTCTNCPAGHAVIKSVVDANPGRVAAIGIQAFGIKQANPLEQPNDPIVTHHDNRTTDGTDLLNGIYGPTAIPVAGIDRSDNATLYGRAEWSATVTNRLSIAPAANVTLTSTYNSSLHQATITARIAYISAISKGQKLTVAVVENNIVDGQQGDGPSNYNQDYIHQHVLRDVLTAPIGDAILTDISIKPAGQVYERTFVYNVNADWNPDNCEIVAFVSNDNGADKEVVQGAIKHLK